MGNLEDDKLAELKEKLPANQIEVLVEEGLVLYYDFYGVTFSESLGERLVVESYIISVVEGKVGGKIRMTRWSDSNNGHFEDHFERI